MFMFMLTNKFPRLDIIIIITIIALPEETCSRPSPAGALELVANSPFGLLERYFEIKNLSHYWNLPGDFLFPARLMARRHQTACLAAALRSPPNQLRRIIVPIILKPFRFIQNAFVSVPARVSAS